MEVGRAKIEPQVIPLVSWIRDIESGRYVLAVRVTRGPDKPYACVHGGRKTYYVRVGNTSREVSREELQRMYPASGSLQYGLKPVPGADLDAFDARRLRDYLTGLGFDNVPLESDLAGWETLLANIGLMTHSAAQLVATIDGILLFGRVPQKYVPQSGIRAICYTGSEPDYQTRADENLRGPMVQLRATDGSLVESGLVEQAWDFIRRNATPTAKLDGAQRSDHWEYPESVVREAIVNALVHRDYSIAGTDIMLAIFADRLEIQSPGGLPNTVTVDGMSSGFRYARNQTLVNVMRDYRYVDARGMGVRNKIIPGMRMHNGTEPDLIAEPNRFTVRLWNSPGGA
jgi:ATP-dependent DNA helicase RecG